MRFRKRYLLLILPALLVRYALSSQREGGAATVSAAPVQEAPVAPRTVAPRALPPPAYAAAALPSLAAGEPGLEPSHPLTPERDLIQHELQLIGALNDALDLRDPARMRTLLDSYREFHPEDAHQLQEGYERLADCLESPGDPSRAEAQAYYDQARASPLRRFVRRICLESDGA